MALMGLSACGGAGDSSTRRSFQASWTPQYSSLSSAWDMSTALLSDGSVLPADVGSSGTLRNPNGTGLASVSGVVGFALHFDGIDDRVVVPFQNNNNNSSLSVSLWVRSPGGSTERAILSSQEAPVAKGYALYLTSAGQPQARVGRGTTQSWAQATGTALLNNTWTHLVFSYDGTYLRLYQNGVLQSSTLTGFLPNLSNPLYIGAGGTELTPSGKDFFLGDIDEVGIWRTPLTDSEVFTIYQHQKL